MCSEIICGLGGLSLSAVLGIGLESVRGGIWPRAMSDDVSLSLFSVCGLLLYRILSLVLDCVYGCGVLAPFSCSILLQ